MQPVTLPGSPRGADVVARRIQAVLASPVPLLILLALGIAARGRQYFANPSYWYDESYVLLNVLGKSFAQLVGPLELEQVTPPLFLWVLKGLSLLTGPAEWAMRLPAALGSLLALLLMVPLARRLVGSPGWLWAVGLCAVSHHALVHSYQVKPYSTDALFTVIVLLAAATYVTADAGSRLRRGSLAGLLAAGALLPWLSFPSVFVLGGASLSLFVDNLRRRQRAAWIGWVAFNTLLVLSFLGLWIGAAHHHNSEAQRRAFGAYFLDCSSPGAAVAWIVRDGVHIGDYADTDLGIPLFVLGVLGLIVLVARDHCFAVLLFGPLALAGFASALQQYPLGDRLCFFVVPCVWLLAATGIGFLAGRLRGRFGWAGLALLAAVLAPGLVRTGKWVVLQEPSVEFREAFTFVRAQQQPGDLLWLSHPHVYEVYFGKEKPVLDFFVSPADLEQAARTHRLWIVKPPEDLTRIYFPKAIESPRAAQAVPVLDRQFGGLEVVLYEPSPGGR